VPGPVDRHIQKLLQTQTVGQKYDTWNLRRLQIVVWIDRGQPSNARIAKRLRTNELVVKSARTKYARLNETPQTIVLDIVVRFPKDYEYHETNLRRDVLRKILDDLAPPHNVRIARRYIDREATRFAKPDQAHNNGTLLSKLLRETLELGRFDKPKIKAALERADWGEDGTYAQLESDLAAILRHETVMLEDPARDGKLPRLTVVFSATHRKGYRLERSRFPGVAQGLDAEIQLTRNGETHGEKITCNWPGRMSVWYAPAFATHRRAQERIIAILGLNEQRN